MVRFAVCMSESDDDVRPCGENSTAQYKTKALDPSERHSP
jgi:hypothetical protein